MRQGTNPDNFISLFDWRARKVWYDVDGHVVGPEFERLAAEKAASGGLSFDRPRWFCADDELIHANGKTYSFSKMWGGQNWHRAMTLLKEKYPEFKIDFAATS